MEDDNDIIDVLNDLRALGVRVAMDDFGTGYSSLAYLNRFPFDKIKIDQSFVREMGGSESAWSIIRAIIGLGNSLGMSVNAEGVETDEQRCRLIAEGCGELQGYFFGRPIPQSALPAVIRQFAAAAPVLVAPAPEAALSERVLRRERAGAPSPQVILTGAAAIEAATTDTG